jgi:rhodanese-related sulfurtransferase
MNRAKIVGALVAVLAAAGLLVMRQPSLDARLADVETELNAALAARTVHIDPAELVDLIYNFNTALQIMDVRDEADYNLFHIVDAMRVTFDQMEDPKWIKGLPKQTVTVLVGNDEKRAVEAWKLLSVQGVNNVYVLAGGINFWLDLYGDGPKRRGEKMLSQPDLPGDDIFRHRFTFALGAKHPGADPDPKSVPPRKYVKKVKPIGRVAKKSGGCG